jgi:hypothetical protein
MDKMHPFFGNMRDPEGAAPSSDPRECVLISQVLACLDPSLNAIENHDLVLSFIAFKSATHTSQRSAALLATVFERLLNWVFFVRRISLVKMQSEDITRFYDFYMSTPTDHLRTVRNCKRFISSSTSCSVNPDWRPFYLPRAQQRCVESIVSVVSALRAFYKYARQCAPVNISVPRYRLVTGLTAPEETSSDNALVERYFESLMSSSKGSTKHRFGRASRHKQIFLFATCYLLEIPFATLSKYTRSFSMSSFSESPQGWRLHLYNDEGVISRGLSERYLKTLLDFRASCGFDGMPSSNEIEPIFGSHAAIKNVLKSLPIFDFMDEAIGKYLRRFISSVNKSAPAVKLLSEVPNDTAHDRRKKKSLRIAAEIFAARKPLCALVRSSNPPPPLFTYHQNSSRLLEFVDVMVLQVRASQHLKVLSDSDAIAINMFARCANGGCGKINRYKISALEKLVLWCIFIKGTNVVNLTENEILDFFHFCYAPPQHWCFTSPAAVGPDRSSTDWRPFKFLLAEDSLHLRAVRIVYWCSSVFQDLVDTAVVNDNPFNEIAKRLGSLRLH